jgi:hypothetical protein
MLKTVLSIAVLVISLPSFADHYITVFEDCNYHGRSFTLEPGNYRTYQMRIDNDKLSCIQIPPGLKVTIYEHDNFSGRSQTFTSNIACLPDAWNDMASSIVVESSYDPYQNPNDYVTFYNDCYMRGYSRTLGPGTYTGNDLGTLKSNISSFSIYGNLRVKAYMTSDNAAGYHINFDENQNCLGSSYNDNIRSLVIEYRAGGYGGGYGGNTGGNNYATVYADCNYAGNSLRLTPGYYQGDKLGLLRYAISSIELPSNLRAKVYINNEYLSGSYYTISQSTYCLSSSMNDRIGSLVIEEVGYGNNNNNYPPNEQRVVLYTDENYRGQSVSLLPGTYYTMAQLGFPDNALSSLTLPPGYRVVLYEYQNFKGKTYTVNQSKPKFYFSGWNDKASSIAVYRDF